MTRTTVRAALIATIACTALAAPAAAGGSFAFTFTPHNKKQAEAVQRGLAAYTGINSGASVRQNGKNNGAGLSQKGKGNLGVIHQDGKGHKGTIDQKGNNNAYGLFQYGRKTDAAITQRGNGNAGLTFLFGW